MLFSIGKMAAAKVSNLSTSYGSEKGISYRFSIKGLSSLVEEWVTFSVFWSFANIQSSNFLPKIPLNFKPLPWLIYMKEIRKMEKK